MKRMKVIFCIKKDSEYTRTKFCFILTAHSYATSLQTYRPNLIMKFFDLIPIGHTISPVNGERPGDRDPHQESNALSLGECAHLGRDISKIQRIYHRQCCKYQAIKSAFFRYKTPTG